MKHEDFNMKEHGFVGHLAEPDSGSDKAVLVIMGGEQSLLPGIKFAERFADYGITGLSVSLFGAEGLPQLPVFGMRFIMPTLADRYEYDGLSGETYPDRKKGASKGVFVVDDLSLTPYLVPQECGMHMDTNYVKVYRHKSLDNSRRDFSEQELVFEKAGNAFSFSCLHIGY